MSHLARERSASKESGSRRIVHPKHQDENNDARPPRRG